MRGMGENHALRLELLLHTMDVADAEIEDGLCHRPVTLRQEQANAVAIEESERAVGVEMAQPQHFAIKDARGANVLNAARDLADRSDIPVCRHVSPPPCKCTAASDATPLPDFDPTGEAELLQHVGDVEFHGVRADTQAPRYHAIGHSVPDLFGHTPFGGCQNVAVPGPSAFLPGRHTAL